MEQVLEGSADRQRMQSHLDAQDVEIVITGAQNTTRIPQKQVHTFFAFDFFHILHAYVNKHVFTFNTK